jgi:steroid delta-isomerase-like uncharacterized protein
MPERNKELAYRVIEDVWSGGNFELVDELLASDFVGHPGGLGEPFTGPGAAKEFIGRLREAFPDITFVVEDMISQGQVVASRWTATGTHDGEFMGIDPTGRGVTFGGMTIFQFDGDLIVEGWTQADALTMLRQMGALPELARV